MFDGIQLIVLGALLSVALLLWINTKIKSFITWRKSGYCRHEWQFWSTPSWYRCTKCGEQRNRGR
jgi:hypothetical protein